MTLSIQDLCSGFGVSQATVERWVRQGKIPASAQGGTLRFRQKDIDKWAVRQNIRMNRPDNRTDTPPEQTPALARAVENGGVYHGIRGKDKVSVIKDCVQRIDIVPEDFRLDFLERIMERENAMSTGIGNGIAIPHPRDPVSYLPRSAIVTFFPESPVEFDAIDGRPVRILFFLLSTSLSHHLPLLSALSNCLKNQAFLAFLESLPTLEALVEEIEILPA